MEEQKLTRKERIKAFLKKPRLSLREIIMILVLISIDIISKNYVTSMPSGGYTALFGEYIGLQLSYNPGIAFSLPITGLPLQIITILVVI